MKTNTILISPIATCRWAHLQTADRPPWITNAGEPGIYSIDLILDPQDMDHAAFIARLEEAYTEGHKRSGVKKAHPRKWKEEVDKETDEPTGMIVLSITQKEWVKRRTDGNKIPMKIHVVDSRGHPSSAEVGNGSKVRVKMELNPFGATTGYTLQLRLRGVQIVEFVGRDDDSGFDAVEGGYEEAAASDESFVSTANTTEDTEDF